MKKFIFSLLSLFLSIGCSNSDPLLEKATIITRSVSQGVITGPNSPEVGRVVTYKFTMSNVVTDNNYELTVKASASGKVRLSEGSDFAKETIKIKAYPGEKVFFFNAIWLEKSNSVSNTKLGIYHGSNIIGEINVNPIDAKVKVTSSGSFFIGSEITITATPQDFGDITGNPIWNYDKQKFSLIKSNTKHSSCYIILKAMTDVASSPVSISVPITYTYLSLSKQTTAIGNTAIKINHPFSITTEAKLMCPNGNIIANMPKLGNVSGATVNWIAGTGLTVTTGQGTGTATFQAATSANGYTSIEARTAYNGKTYSSKIDSIWIGKPMIINTEDQFTIEDRSINVGISPKAIGIDGTTNYKWVLEEGIASIKTYKNGYIEIKSLTENSSTDNIIISLEVNNSCNTQTKKFYISVIEGADIITDIFAYDGAYVDIPVTSKYSNILSPKWLMGESIGQYVRFTFDYAEWIKYGMPKVYSGSIFGKDGKRYSVKIKVI